MKVTVRHAGNNSRTAACRGMSEPFYFAFDSLGRKMTKDSPMVAHGVIFSSFLVSGTETLSICIPKDDPRMDAFVKWVWSNFLEEERAKHDKLVAEMQEMIKNKDAGIAELKAKIAEIDKALTTKPDEPTQSES